MDAKNSMMSKCVSARRNSLHRRQRRNQEGGWRLAEWRLRGGADVHCKKWKQVVWEEDLRAREVPL